MRSLDPKEVEISVRRWVEQNGGDPHEAQASVYFVESCECGGKCLTVELDDVAISVDIETMNTFPELLPQLLRRHLRSNRVA